MKKLLFLGACLVALASQPVMAQTGGADVVVVQVSFGLGAGQILISRGGGKTEVVEIKKQNRNAGFESEAYQQVISKLYQEGYTIKSTFSDGVRNQSNIVFVKGQ
jgi:hypothetical protein